MRNKRRSSAKQPSPQSDPSEGSPNPGDLRETFAFAVIAILVVNRQGKVLLQERTKPGDEFYGYLELPQGRLRHRESILACAQRELEEETGLKGFRPAQSVSDEIIERTSVQYLTGVAVGMVGRKTYLAIAIMGNADGRPRNSSEGHSHRWWGAEAVEELLLARRVVPLNVPMLRSFVATAKRSVDPTVAQAEDHPKALAFSFTPDYQEFETTSQRMRSLPS
jgi:8-oxo-dGTP pyrophosphatase MutT (NUDIX family)